MTTVQWGGTAVCRRWSFLSFSGKTATKPSDFALNTLTVQICSVACHTPHWEGRSCRSFYRYTGRS